MKKGSSFWLRNKSLARFMSVLLSVSMVLSLLPAQGVQEARSEFLLATTVAHAEESSSNTTDPGGGEGAGKPAATVADNNTEEGSSSSSSSSSEQEPGEPTEVVDNTGQEPADGNAEETDVDETKPVENPSEETTDENAGTATDSGSADANKDSGSSTSGSESSSSSENKAPVIPASANLADFITNAAIEGAEEQDGKLSVKEGESYTAKLTFAERADKQFANEGELTYALPQGFVPSADQPASHEALYITCGVDENGEPIRIELGRDSWWIDGTTLHLVWKVRDAESRSADDVAQAMAQIQGFNNIEFELAIVGSFAAGTESVSFGAPTAPISIKVESAMASEETDKSDDQKKDNESKKSEEQSAKKDDEQKKAEQDASSTNANKDAETNKDANAGDSQTSLVSVIRLNNVVNAQATSVQGITTKEGFEAALHAQEETNLKAFLTDATINAPKNEAGEYQVNPGQSYNISLFFAEQPDGIQFPAPGTEMTYTIPAQIENINGTSGQFTINVTDTSTGQVYAVPENTYRVNGNTLTVTFNPNAQNIDKLKASANARFNVSFTGTINENATQIPFSDTVNKTVHVDNSSDVTVSKSGYFDLAKKKVFYTVTVYSSGNSTNVHVWDEITDTANVITGISNFHYNSSTRGSDFTEGVTGSVSGKSYDYRFDNMSRGETITFTYEGDIDPSKIPVDPNTGKVTYSANNSVDIESTEDSDNPPVEKQVVIDYTPKLNKTGVVSEDGKTITYTVTYNDDGLASMKGKTLTDKIRESSQQYLKFPAQSVEIKAYTVNRDQHGNKTGETLAATRSLAISEGSEFSYQVPNDDPAYKYVLTFTAQVQNTNQLNNKPTTVYNDVEVPGNKTSDGETIQPEGGVVTVDKEVTNVDARNKEISWTSTFTVPTTGLDYAVATDTYPNTWAVKSGTHVYEPIKHGDVTDFSSSNNWTDGQVTITGLKDNEHVTVDYNVPGDQGQSSGARFTFYKSAGTAEEGINGGNDIRTVTITYKTTIDDDWYANWSKEPGHTNSFNLNGESDTATAYVVQDGVTKSGQKWGTRTVNGVELPIYEYTIQLNNVTSDINVITDTFPTDVLEPFDPSSEPCTKTANNEHSWWAWRTAGTNWNSRSEEQVEYVPTATGMQITTSASSMVHDKTNPTGFYPQTTLVYYLTVKDQAALIKLQGDAAQSPDQKATIRNDVKWNDKTGGSNVEYEYPALDKEILTPDSELAKTDQDIWADYRISYNPGGATMHNGAVKDMTDTVTNQSIDITSISISPAGTGITYDMEGDVLTFKNVPDSTPIVITYRARVKFNDIGSSGETVNVPFSNKVEIEGFEDDVNKTAKRTNSGSGAAEIYSIKLMKYQAGNMANRLNGAEFQLYHAKPDATNPLGFVIDESNPVKDINGEVVTFTAGGERKYGLDAGQTTAQEDPGMVTVKGDQTKDGWTINADTYYFLKETKAPNGYMLANFDYAFRVSADGTTNYSKYIYHSGDTLSAKNYRGSDLIVLKDWSDGNDAHESDTVTVRLQQRRKISDNPEQWSDWSNTIRRQDNGTWADVSGDVEGKTILTLNKSNDWQGKFPSLPSTVPVDLNHPDDGDDVQVEYQIREWKINSTDADVEVTANAQNGKNNEYSWAYGGSGNVKTISNSPLKGSLKLTKLVTVNGAETDGTLADGEYTFKIAGPANSSPAVEKTVKVTITKGVIVSAAIDNQAATLKDGYVEIPELSAGDYTITETNLPNNMELVDATGGTSVSSDKVVTATVEAGKTGDNVPTVGISSFTNNLKPGSLKIKKNLTVNGTPLADAVTQGAAENNAVDGTYIFQVWAGAYGSSSMPYARVEITFASGAITSAKYEIVSERNGGTINWHDITPGDDGSVQLDGLTPGNYTIHEITGSLPDGVSLTGGNDKQVSVTSNNTANVPTVSLTNNKSEKGDLELSKQIVSTNPADQSVSFNFTVTLSDTSITGNYGGMTFENGVAKVNISGGQTRKAEGLPTGVTYTITEAAATGFSLTGITRKVGTGSTDQLNDGKATGTITKTPSQVEFKNNRDEGQLEVKKIIQSNFPNDLTKKFTFTVTLTNSTLSGTFGDMTFNNGVATFELTNDESKVATGLPAGQAYTVSETTQDGFALTWTGNTSSGTIAKDQKVTAEAKNTRKYGDLEVDKTVVSSNSQHMLNQEFNFTVTLFTDSTYQTVADIDGTFGTSSDENTKVLNFNDGVATVTLKHGQKAIASQLPEGTAYRVTEQSVEGYVTGSVGEEGTITSNTLSKAEFTNTEHTGGLVLQKHVVSANKDDEGKYFTFVVSLLKDDESVNTGINETFGDLTFVNGVATVLLRHGQTVVANGIQENTKFKIEEVDTTADTFAAAGSKTADNVYSEANALPARLYGTLEGEFNTTIRNGAGQATTGTIVKDKIVEGTTSARYTNSRVSGSLTVSKELISKNAADANQEFNFHVDLYTKADDSTETPAKINGTFGGMTFTNGSATVRLKGGQSITADNLPVNVYYRVTEDSVDGFTATGSTNTEGIITTTGETAKITNTRVDTDLPIRKEVRSDWTGDASKTFPFMVKLTGLTEEAANATYELVYDPASDIATSVKFTNGEASIQVPANTTAYVKGLPTGVSYTVTENISANYTNTDIQNNRGTIAEGMNPVVYVNERAYGEVTISKLLMYGLEGDENQEFEIRVILYQLTRGDKTYGGLTFVDKGESHEATFELKGGESKTITGIPVGVLCSIVEDFPALSPRGFEFMGYIGPAAPTISSTPQNVTLRNGRPPATLRVSKELISEATADANQTFTFDVEFSNLNQTDKNGTFTLETSTAGASNVQTGTLKLTNGKGTITLKGNQTATIKDVPSGAQYTVTERSIANFQLVGEAGNTQTRTNTLPRDGATETFKNERKTGGFSLAKVVTTQKGTPDTNEFNFTVRLTGVNMPQDQAKTYGKIIRKDGTEEDLSFTNSIANIVLKDGDKIYAEGLPIGTKYTISEQRDSSYTTTVTGVDSSKVDYNNGSYVIVNDTVADEDNQEHTYSGPTYNNSRDEGSLSVHKTVTSTYPPDLTYDFEFTVTLDNKTINNQKDGDTYPYVVIANGDKPIEFRNGVATFTLKHDETASIKGLPAGVKYTVTEKAADGFATTWSGNTSGTIKKDELASVTARNRCLPGDLDVTKTVVSHTAEDYNRFYPFKVFFFTEMPDEAWVSADGTLSAEGTAKLATDVAGTYDIVNATTGAKQFTKNFSGGIAEFNMEGDRTAKFADLPQALYYMAYEVTPDGFQLQKSGQVGKIAANNAANFYNTRVEGGFYVGKSVQSALKADKDKKYHFTVTLYTDEACTQKADINGKYPPDEKGSGAMTFTDGETSFDLKDSEVAFALNLPLGSTGLYYKVVEDDYSGEGFKTYVGEVTSEANKREVTGHLDPTTADKPVTQTFINVRENGNLKVIKSNDSDVKDGQKFDFKVELFQDAPSDGQGGSDSSSDTTGGIPGKVPAPINGTYGGMSFTNGVATFSLGKGESLSTANEQYTPDDDEYYTLPVGIVYRVTETHADGYTTTWTNTTNRDTNYRYSYRQKIDLNDGIWEVTKQYRSINGGGSTYSTEGSVWTTTTDGVTSYHTWDKLDAVTGGWMGDDGYNSKYVPAITANNTDEAEFTNNREYGNLKVTKEVQSQLEADKTKKFSFRVVLGDTSINGTYGNMSFTNGVAEFKLANGEYRFANHLPKGTKFNVYEEADNDFRQSDAQASGVIGYGLDGEVELANPAYITDGDTLDKIDIRAITTYRNDREEGELQLYKNVTSDLQADKDRDYEFTVTLDPSTFGTKDGSTYTFTLYRMVKDDFGGMKVDTSQPLTFTNGVATLNLKDGQSAIIGRGHSEASQMDYDENVFVYCAYDAVENDVIPGLPVGLTYTVDEQTYDGISTTWSGKTGKTSTTPAVVDCTNTRQTGGLTVSKEVISEAAADKTNKTFKFTVSLFTNENRTTPATDINGVYGTGTTAMEFHDGVAQVELKHDQSATATGLPKGLYYTITEASVPNFELKDITVPQGVDKNKNEGTAKGQITQDGATITYENERLPGDLVLSKQLVSDAAADANTEFEFTVRLNDSTIGGPNGKTYNTLGTSDKSITFVNGIGKVTLKGGETASVRGLPREVGYTVTEKASTGFNVTKSGDTGTISSSPSQVEFTNTRQVGDLTVSKQLFGAATAPEADKNKEFDFTVTLSDTTIGGEDGKTYGTGDTAITFKKGVAKFKLKHDQSKTAVGLPTGISYTVTEESTPGFSLYGKTGDTGVIATTPSTATITNIHPDKPSFEKKIRDKNDTTDTGSDWQDSADYDIGDAVPFKLTATLSKDVTAYHKYHITFTDKMEPSLTFKQDSVRVELNGEELASDKYTLNRIDDQNFTVRLEWVGEEPNARIADTGLNNAIVDVYFDATLNENAKLGKEGNINACKLAYSNKPDVEDSEDNLPWDYVIAFTYKVDVNKTDQDGNALEGAQFMLEKLDKSGSALYTVGENYSVASVSGNTFSFTGLDDGTYRLTETQAPSTGDASTSFKPMDPLVFTVTAGHTDLWDYTSTALGNADPVFDVSSRRGILTSLTGSEETGALDFSADAALSTLTSDLKNQGLGSLKITKNVTENGATLENDTKLNGTYHFTVTGPGEYSQNVEVEVTDGKSNTVQLDNLVPGEYTVTEDTSQNPAGMSLIGAKSKTVTVRALNKNGEQTNVIETAEFTNTKPGTPGFDKKIKDKNDSKKEESNWQDSADYDIGDAVPYKLSATLPNDVTAYHKYHITFTDKMEDSLDFNENSVEVKIGDKTLAKDTDYTLTKVDDHNFTVRVNWEGENDGLIADTTLNGAVVDVFFNATLNSKAKVGKEGNVNACKLNFSNNPDVDKPEEEGELPWDYVIAFTYKVNVNKTDENGDALEGAEFTLEKLDKDGNVLHKVGDAISLASVEGNVFSFTGLDDGIYRLTETKAPEMFGAIEPIVFEVTADHTIDWDYTSEDAEPVFDVDGRYELLTSLTGNDETGTIALEADSDLGTLTGSVANTPLGGLKITKRESKPLSSEQRKGFKFTVTGPEGSDNPITITKTLDEFTQQGKNLVWTLTDLELGTYTIKEVKNGKWGAGDTSATSTYSVSSGKVTVARTSIASITVNNVYGVVKGTAQLKVNKAFNEMAEGFEYNGDEEFTFELNKAEVNGTTSTNDSLPENTTVTVTKGTNGKYEAQSFDDIAISSTEDDPLQDGAEFYYTITEQVPEDKTPGMTYAGTMYAKVVVPKADFSEDPEVYYSTSLEELQNGGGTKIQDQNDAIAVTNSYEVGNLKVVKQVEGLPEGSFEAKEYKVTVQGPDGRYLYMDDGGLVAYSDEAVDNILSVNAPLEFNKVPLGTYTVTETDHGEDVVEVDGKNYYFSEDESVTTATPAPTVEIAKTAEGVIKNTYTHPEAKASLKVSKAVSGEYTGDDTFEFVLAKEDDSTSDEMPETTTATAKAGETATFGEITYTEPGDYYYTINEVEPTENKVEGMVYDTTAKFAWVTVDEDMKTVTVQYASNGVSLDDENLEWSDPVAPEEATAPVVTNILTKDDEAAISLEATKKLTGKSLTARAFTFTLKDKDGNEIETRTNTKDGAVNFAPITYKEAGTYEYTISEVKGKLSNITYDTHEAKVTVEVKKDDTGKLVATATYDKDAPATFNNTYTPPETPSKKTSGITWGFSRYSTARTGDNTSILPIVILVVAGGVGIAIGVIYRRRQE